MSEQQQEAVQVTLPQVAQAIQKVKDEVTVEDTRIVLHALEFEEVRADDADFVMKVMEELKLITAETANES